MNSQIPPTHVVEFWGDFACFSRPELSVERYSYPCPTPSAARGALEAVYYKPEFRWQPVLIEVLSLPTYIALRRNEVKDKVNESAVKKWMAGKEKVEPLWADADASFLGTDQKGRTQRQTMALRNPRFRLHGRIVPRPGHERDQAAYDEQFVRRASQGKCWMQPYFGCREFVAFFRYIAEVSAELPPVPYTQDLGYMLYDVFDLRKDNHAQFHDDWRGVAPFVSIFKARIEKGVLDVPPFESDAVLKPDTQE